MANRREFLSAAALAAIGAVGSRSVRAVEIPASLPSTGKDDPALAAFDRLMLSFMQEYDVPGGSLAIGRKGRVVYARGFGYADVEHRVPFHPEALCRIASVSKPFTSAAILRLAEGGKFRLDDSAFRVLDFTPHLERGGKIDPRLWNVTISQLLHHTGGFDSRQSFDPMFRSVEIAQAMGAKPPAMPRQIVEYMMGRPLDFEPGTRYAYSNFGYCVLGRIIEKMSGMPYDSYVKELILRLLGIRRMRLGRSLEEQRDRDEVRYYPRDEAKEASVFDPDRRVQSCYGGWCIEAMDSHGGWLASAPDLIRFAMAFDDRGQCPILTRQSIGLMFQRPPAAGEDNAGNPHDAFYACGWSVRELDNQTVSTWHTGLVPGQSSLLVRRHDGLSWAILFNRDFSQDHTYLMKIMDARVHPVANGISRWPADG